MGPKHGWHSGSITKAQFLAAKHHPKLDHPQFTQSYIFRVTLDLLQWCSQLYTSHFTLQFFGIKLVALCSWPRWLRCRTWIEVKWNPGSSFCAKLQRRRHKLGRSRVCREGIGPASSTANDEMVASCCWNDGEMVVKWFFLSTKISCKFPHWFQRQGYFTSHVRQQDKTQRSLLFLCKHRYFLGFKF